MASINEFQDLLCEHIPQLNLLGQKIGGLVENQTKLVGMAFDRQLEFIRNAAISARPSSDAQFAAMLKPMSDLICQAQDIREKNRHHEQFNHLSAISEGIGAVGWVTVAPTPAPYIKEMSDSAQFYTNKILVNFKSKGAEGEPHIEWAKSWIAFLAALQTYVRKHHTTGLVWAASGSGAAAAPPPPPPPPMMSSAGDQITAQDKAMNDARAALFASINQGEDITKMLKKVSTTDMTHKNPALRGHGATPGVIAAGVVYAQAKNVIKGPEKFVLEGKKWLIENLTGRKDLIVEAENMSQSVCVFRCEDCVLQVKNKVNSIVVDQCKKFSIAFDSIVSAVEFINSKRIQAQAMAVVPTVTMDSVEDIELYLGKDSLTVEIVSSKSTSINVSVPGPTGEYVEHPIPEQLKTTWSGRGFQTVAVDKNV